MNMKTRIGEIIDYMTPDVLPDVIDYNKMLAEYMGYRYFYNVREKRDRVPGWKNHEAASNFSKLNDGTGYHFICRNHKQLAFHRDWNWLMPVCSELFRRHGFLVKFYGNVASVCHVEDYTRPRNSPANGLPLHYFGDSYSNDTDDLIVAVWEACVLLVRYIKEHAIPDYVWPYNSGMNNKTTE